MKRGVLGAVVLLVSIGLIMWGRRRSPFPTAPARDAYEMCTAPGAVPASGVWSEAILSAVARELQPDERTALEEALTTAKARWETRANPLIEDLDDSDPDGALIAWFKTAPSFLRTAQAATRVPSCAADGFCAIPRRPGRACPDGFLPAPDAEIDRARFVVWPWGHALRMRAPSADEARSSASSIRAAARSSTRIAIVLASDDGAVTKEAPYKRMRDLWARVTMAKRIAQDGAAETPSEAFVATVDDPCELVILPRLEAITDRQGIEAEIRAVAPTLHAGRP